MISANLRSRQRGNALGNDINKETIYCVVSNDSETCSFNFDLYHKPIASTTLTVNGTVTSGNAIPVHIGESYHHHGKRGCGRELSLEQWDGKIIFHNTPSLGPNTPALHEPYKCGFTQTSAIAKISDVRLTKTSLDYNGKNQKLALTVRDRAGRQLQAGTDYDCLLIAKKTVKLYSKWSAVKSIKTKK